MTLICTILFLLLPWLVQAKQVLTIPGTGDSQGLLRDIAGQFMKQYPEYQVDIPDSIGSSGGIRGVLKGRFKLARTARPLKPNEQDGTLIEYPFALSPVVFTTHPSVRSINHLCTDQIIDIYTGKITNWSQVGGIKAKIYPVDRETGDSSRSILERHMTGFKNIRSVAKVFYNTPETIEAIKSHQQTLGFIPLGPAGGAGLNILAIDGIYPDKDSVQNRRYPYVSTFSFVSRSEVSGVAKKFINYIYDADAIDLIRKRGLLPVKKERNEPAR